MIHRSDVPLRVAGYAVEQIDAELLLYHADRSVVVYLNETALLVWQLCDGQRSVGEIIEMLEAAYVDAGDAVAADVPGALERLTGLGVIAWASSP